MRWDPAGLSENELDQARIKFHCAFDGSEVSRSALDFLLDYLLSKRKNAEAEAIYVEDPTKTYLPPAQRRGAVEAVLKPHKFLFPGRLNHRVLMKESGKCVGQTLTEYSIKEQADFMIIGMYGRKGIKDHTETVMASNANYALQYAQCSTILIQEPFLPYSCVHFLVAMDRTKSSEKALVDALLLSEPDDRITLLHIIMQDEMNAANDLVEDPLKGYKAKLKPMIEKYTSEIGRPRTVNVVYQVESPEPVAHDILDYASKNNVHVMCLGANTKRLRENKTYMGSTSTSVMVNCVREGVPVVIAHYDDQFAEKGHDTVAAPRPYEPLPKTAQFATPGPAAAWDHKYRCGLSVGRINYSKDD